MMRPYTGDRVGVPRRGRAGFKPAPTGMVIRGVVKTNWYDMSMILDIYTGVRSGAALTRYSPPTPATPIVLLQEPRHAPIIGDEAPGPRRADAAEAPGAAG